MINNCYILLSAGIATLLAQLLKPFVNYHFTKQWDWKLILSSGGFPSSHSAAVMSLALAVGLKNGFYSDAFAICIVIALVVAYDAMNVRYYAGQNIKMTKQLIKDISELTQIKLDDPIYSAKIKTVLGHKFTEVVGGSILGLTTALVLALFI